MTDIEVKHCEMVRNLAKSADDILDELDPFKCDLMHATMGISSEAGEILDIAKKIVVYNQPPDVDKLNHFIEELGDIEFYLRQLYSVLGITREDALRANMAKLAKRYPNFTYTDDRARERADKNDPQPS